MSERVEPTREELDFIQSCQPADHAEFIRKCSVYQEFLYTVNETFNLTRIPPEEFWSKHVCDCLSLGRIKPEIRREKIRLCDVGCGAGLPSLILAAAYPELQICAIDSRGKKQDFVAQAARKMGLNNVHAFQARSNELGRENEYNHVFRIITARAVSSADTLIRDTRDLLSRKGELVIYRTPSQAEPEYAALTAAKKKPARILMTDTLELPGNAGTRNFLILGSSDKN